MRFPPRNPRYAERVAALFAGAPFIRDLGIELVACGPGWCETALGVAPRHLQQDGYVHAGVQATLADHTAGAAAGTLMRAEQIVLTVEFKINMLRGARGDRLRCRAEVLRPGNQLTVAESQVFAIDAGAETLAAQALVTLALVSQP